VFATSRGTPFGVRNVARRILKKAADDAGLNDGKDSALRFHDLRHTFASHLIVDLGLDVAQVGPILGHASIAITLDVYTHLFDGQSRGEERWLMAIGVLVICSSSARKTSAIGQRGQSTRSKPKLGRFGSSGPFAWTLRSPSPP
jgi:hypothetical protein